VKLLTFGVGEVDKDAVLQAAKAKIDGIQPARQQIVLEALDILRSLAGGRVEAAGLGLVKEVIDELSELAGGLGDFSNHEKEVKGSEDLATARRF
jgi:hypothetical protein